MKGAPLTPGGVISPPFLEVIVTLLICVNWEGAWFFMTGLRGTELDCYYFKVVNFNEFITSDRLGFVSIIRSG